MHEPRCHTLFSSITTAAGTVRAEPTARAVAEAVIADYRDTIHPTSRKRVDLTAFVDREVTVLFATQNPLNAPVINSCEGILISTPDNTPGNTSGNSFSLLMPRRQPGRRTLEIPIGPDQVLDVEPGYGHTHTLAARLETTRQRYPHPLERLTPRHLQTLPERAPDPAHIGLVIFGTWPTPEGDSSAALWLLHSYLHDDDIAEGVLLVRPDHGYSEHGSAYGRHLLGMSAGVVVDPPPLTLIDALDLTDRSHEEALATFAARPSQHQ